MIDKQTAFEKVAERLQHLKFDVIDKDYSRSWGGFFVMDKAQATAFAKHLFPDENFDAVKITNNQFRNSACGTTYKIEVEISLSCRNLEMYWWSCRCCNK